MWRLRGPNAVKLTSKVDLTLNFDEVVYDIVQLIFLISLKTDSSSFWVTHFSVGLLSFVGHGGLGLIFFSWCQIKIFLVATCSHCPTSYSCACLAPSTLYQLMIYLKTAIKLFLSLILLRLKKSRSLNFSSSLIFKNLNGHSLWCSSLLLIFCFHE